MGWNTNHCATHRWNMLTSGWRRMSRIGRTSRVEEVREHPEAEAGKRWWWYVDEREGETKAAYMCLHGEEANMSAAGAGSGWEPSCLPAASSRRCPQTLKHPSEASRRGPGHSLS